MRTPNAELQKRADRADQSVLFFLAGANFWEKHAKNCAILCIFCVFFGANFLGGKLVGANFYAFCNYVLKVLDERLSEKWSGWTGVECGCTPTTTRASMVLTNIILLNKYIIDIPTVPCFIDSVVMLGQP